MRFRRSRLTGALSTLFLVCGLACSSQQQQEEGLEVSGQEQSADNQAGANGESAENADQGEDGGGNENIAANNQETSEEINDEGGDETETAEGGNATENDLQNIIQEMNGQQASGEAAAGGDASTDSAALAQNAGAAPAEAAPSPEAPAAEAAPLAAAPAAAPASAVVDQAGAVSSSSNPIPFQPGGAPAGAGLPELGSKMAYIVQKGDTLGKISTKIYGSTSRWNEIAKLSGMQNPNRIFAGDVVYYTLDEAAIAFATGYEKAQRSEEQVKPGDTLATIAQRVYGTTSAWRSIWRQNDRIDNPDIVPPGTTIFYLNEAQLSAAVKQAKNKLAKIKVSKNQKSKLAKLKAKNFLHNPNQLSAQSANPKTNHISLGNGIQIVTIKLTDSVSWYLNATAAMA